MSTPIELKYQTLGGRSSFLGEPVSPGPGGLPVEQLCPDARGRYMHYQYGSIYWTQEMGAFEVHGLIRKKWADLGWERSFLGYPLSDEHPMADGVGRLNDFQYGQIVWTPSAGAHPIAGEIGAKWVALGAENGFLGYPVEDENRTPDDRGRYQHFQFGSIYWTQEWGAYEVHGLIRQRWSDLGWERGFLGYPVSDELPLPLTNGSPRPPDHRGRREPVVPKGGRYNVFEHGIITWIPGQVQAIESPHHYERLYSQIRAQILTRFFALGAKGRRNHYSGWNELAEPLPTQPINYAGKIEIEKGRLRIKKNGGENPMEFGAYLYIMLSVEHHFGNEESTRALKSGLATLESLFVWQTPGDPSSRLPIRWDAGIPTDKYSESEQFLSESSGNYSTGIRSTDIHHFPARDLKTLTNLIGPAAANQYISDQECFKSYRSWELSTDELTGLVTTYWIVNKLSHDTEITASVQRQARFLGNYLANNGYFLVRPMGGLSWRGASATLPALEYPFSRVLSSVGGFNADSRADFRQAMEKAGYWRNLEGPITNWQIAAWVTQAGGVLGILAPVALAAGFDVNAIISGLTLSPGTVGAAAAVLINCECFDIEEKTEPAVALLLKAAINKRMLYQAIASGSAFTSNPGTQFHRWIGLTGVDDPDPTVRTAFGSWYNLRLTGIENLSVKERKSDGVLAIYTTGVATITGTDPRGEEILVERIERAIVENFRDCYFEPKMHSVDKEEYSWIPGYFYDNPGTSYHSMDLCTGLALAFWHAERRLIAGNPVTTPRFPQPLAADRFAAWPKAGIRVDCASVLDESGIDIHLESIMGTTQPRAEGGIYPLFSEPPVPRRPSPPARGVAPGTVLICDTTVIVRAKDRGDIPTGVTLHPGLHFEINAAGSIHAGGIADPWNGPEGLSRLIDDASWPLHTGLNPLNAKAFCMLGRLNGYFYVGDALPRQSFRYTKPRPLFLRINDDHPGDGDGEFSVQIRVWGPGRPPRIDPAIVYRPPNILRDGGTLWIGGDDVVDVRVDYGVVAPDTVEFCLETTEDITWQKELVIQESAATGGQAWTIFTKDSKHNDQSGLYAYQLNGSLITLRKQKPPLGQMFDIRVLNISEALPGTRITFIWTRDR